MSGRILLGTQSWNFRAWCGPFYPPGTRSADMLAFYGHVFPTLEVDATFYGVPAQPVLEDWSRQVPLGFQFSLKVPQQITHDLRLVGAQDLVARFADRVRALGTSLGPLLVQLSPDFPPSPEHRAALRAFLPALAPDLRWAVEFRHEGWSEPSVLDLLAEHGVAHALADGRWYPRNRLLELAETPTAPFAYIRWMGDGRRITDYSRPTVSRDDDLAAWAPAVKSLAAKVEVVYGYFNNQFEGHSPHSVRAMQRQLEIDSVDPTRLHPQRELFSP